MHYPCLLHALLSSLSWSFSPILPPPTCVQKNETHPREGTALLLFEKFNSANVIPRPRPHPRFHDL